MIGWLVAGLIAAAAPQVAPRAPESAPQDERVSQGAVRGAQETGTRWNIETRMRGMIVADLLPRRNVSELRPQVGVEITAAPTSRVVLRLDALAEALIADRGGRVTGAGLHVRDAWIEMRGARADLRMGYGRLVWGKLDEIAPTDVINPLDAGRFLLEGRSEARLPVAFVRGRFYASDRLNLEGVLVPVFRRGVFDRLDEKTSPFNLVTDATIPPGIQIDLSDRLQVAPAATWTHMSGGTRLQATAGGLDASVSVYRGFDGVGPILPELQPGTFPPIGRLVEYHPRFTMIGADMETVTGAWAWRAEIATFVERSFTAGSGTGLVRGRSLDAGAGVDRRLGEYRVFTSVIIHRDWSEEDPLVAGTDVNLVGSIERTFDRERYLARLFAVVNPRDHAAFVRGLISWRPSDPMAVEFSAGAFAGTSDDTIGRFRTRDFLLTRVRWDW